VGLDIRLPIGLMFIALGPLLLATGLLGGEPLSTRTGLAMSAFGIVMLGLGIRGQRRSASAARSSTSEPR
jgi:hypothetical protein